MAMSFCCKFWGCCGCWPQRVRKRTIMSAITDVKESFDIFDKDHDGTISAKEIVSTFKEMNLPIDEKEAEALVAEFDENGDGVINFEEFISLMKTYLRADDNQTYTMFEYFDRDNDGFITRDEFVQSMRCLGVYLTKAEADAILGEFYQEGTNHIGVDEFSTIMRRYI